MRGSKPARRGNAASRRRAGVWARILAARVGQFLSVLFGLSVVSFLLVRMLPGGPAQTLVGVRASPEAIAKINEQLGLHEPIVKQYWLYLCGLVKGDLGTSFLSGAGVTSIVASHLGDTLLLIVYAVVLALVIGVPLSVLAAVRSGQWPDHLIRGIVVVGFGLPSFWLGVLLVSFLGLRLGWFPSGGAGDGLVGKLWHLLLPALTLGLTFLAVLVRSLRASLSEILHADYIDAARLKGISRVRLFSHHVLRTALVPVVVLVGLNMSYLLGTSVVVENVFAIDGIGQQLVSAVLQRDFMVVQGIVLVFGVIVLLITLATGAVQSLLDPRNARRSRG